MSTLYIVRHGQTVWNTEKRIQGHQNSPLTNLGKEQALRTGQRLENIEFSKVFTSDSERAIETTTLITLNRPNEIYLDERLREIMLGHWEGKSYEDVLEKEKDMFHNFRHNPRLFIMDGMETFSAVRERTLSFLKEIITNEDENILIVSHAVTILSMLSYWLGEGIFETPKRLTIESCSISTIKTDKDFNNEIQVINDITHLSKGE